MSKIRVLIVDDHPLMRSALRNALDAESDIEVSDEAVNGQQALELYNTTQPDLIVMDLFMPVLDGIEAIHQIIKFHPEAKILAITSSIEDDKVLAAIRAGAMGYLLKDATREKLIQGIRSIAMGERFIPPDIADKLARGLQSEGKQPVPLTHRELEILGLIGEGLSNTQIAEKLYLSNSTIRVHVFNILDKLGLDERNQAIIFANKNHILFKPDDNHHVD